jgi:hypothetical protein
MDFLGMEGRVNDQLHAPAAVPPKKEAPISIE